MGTADFPYLTGAIIERELVGGFNYPQTTIEPIFRKATRLNFGTKRTIRLDGGDQLLVEVTESGSFAVGKVTESEWEYSIKEYGRVIPLTLQMLAGDDLNAFQQIPAMMGRGARLTRQQFMTSLLMTTTGWTPALFSGGGAEVGGQAAVATGALTAENLAAGLKAMSLYTDKKGNPILANPKYLVVNKSLAQKAYELTQAQTLATLVTGLASTSSKSTELATMVNWIQKFGLTVLEDPWIGSVCSSGTIGATAWGLFADPMDIAAAEFGVWAPAPEPQVLMKASDQVMLSGGSDPFNTTFDPEGRIYKVRDVHGGVAMAPQGRYLSNGQ
jgi:hypothetical protein